MFFCELRLSILSLVRNTIVFQPYWLRQVRKCWHLISPHLLQLGFTKTCLQPSVSDKIILLMVMHWHTTMGYMKYTPQRFSSIDGSDRQLVWTKSSYSIWLEVLAVPHSAVISMIFFSIFNLKRHLELPVIPAWIMIQCNIIVNVIAVCLTK